MPIGILAAFALPSCICLFKKEKFGRAYREDSGLFWVLK